MSNYIAPMQASPGEPHALPFFLPYLVPLMTVVAHYSSNKWYALAPSSFVWVFVPLMDYLVGRSTQSFKTPLSRIQRQQIESKLSFKLAVHLWCPTQLAVLLWAAYRIEQQVDVVSGIRLYGLVCSVALHAAEGINCSHELLHRHSVYERLMGKILLVSVLYGHFTIEHARGHHFRVATPEDPATFRFNESFYSFLPRTVVCGYLSAWHLECVRLRRNGKAIVSLHNEMILYAACQVATCAFFYLVFGKYALFMFLFQAIFAVLLLEQINAIEHYGLVRKRISSVAYERVNARHSWDAPNRISSYLLFKLQLHADHHLRKLSLFTSNSHRKLRLIQI